MNSEAGTCRKEEGTEAVCFSVFPVFLLIVWALRLFV